MTVTDLADHTSYHWRARTVDELGGGQWVGGLRGECESAADFVVNTNQSPNAPGSPGQFKSNGITTVPVGGTTDETTVVLKGTVSDPDGNTVKLEVEVRPLGAGFTNTATQESGLVGSGSVASVTVSDLANNTSYHWQARTVDSQGRPVGGSPSGGMRKARRTSR